MCSEKIRGDLLTSEIECVENFENCVMCVNKFNVSKRVRREERGDEFREHVCRS